MAKIDDLKGIIVHIFGITDDFGEPTNPDGTCYYCKTAPTTDMFTGETEIKHDGKCPYHRLRAFRKDYFSNLARENFSKLSAHLDEMVYTQREWTQSWLPLPKDARNIASFLTTLAEMREEKEKADNSEEAVETQDGEVVQEEEEPEHLDADYDYVETALAIVD